MKKVKIIAVALVVSTCMIGCGQKGNNQVTESAEAPISVSLYEADNIKVGDFVLFGSYEQDNDMSNGQEAIDWLVLDVKEDKVLLVAKYGLDCQSYHETEADVVWEDCTLRGWLNNEFYTKAFQSDEQERIETATIANEANPWWGTPIGNDTQDKVFLLSIQEATEYFPEDSDTKFSWDENLARAQLATAYAIAQGVEISTTHDYYGTCWAWLRTPGMVEDASCIQYTGTIHYMGADVDDKKAVRPAVWVNLKSE